MIGMTMWQRANFEARAYLYGAGLGVALTLGFAGCHKTPDTPAATATVDQNGADPADANMAPVSGAAYASGGAPQQPARVLGQRSQNEAQQQAEDYSPQQQAAPIERRAPDASGDSADNSAGSGGMSDAQAADVYASDLTDEQASQPPPPLPEYEQPPAPEPDYLWTPGYWAWGTGGYYWVPGAWVGAPYAGALWTPGYWGYVGNVYRFHRGFWGLHIGFYGGVDYGYGYVGHGYYGGYWNHDHFFYNTAINRVNVNVIRNVYVHNVVINNVTINNRIVNRVSYNGGRGGLAVRPVAAEVAVLHEQRNAPMVAQVQLRQEASQNRAQFYSENKGRPAMAVAAHAVVADRTPPPPLPRATAPAQGIGIHGEQAKPNLTPGPTGRVEPQNRPGMPQQGAPQHVGPASPQVRNVPEASRPGQTTPQNRPGEVRPNQSQPQNQGRPEYQGRPETQARPNTAPQPQNHAPQPTPAPQVRPTQPTTPVRPAPEVHPAPTQPVPHVPEHTAPQPATRATPPPQQPHPQPQAHPAPAPAPRAEPHTEERPRR